MSAPRCACGWPCEVREVRKEGANKGRWEHDRKPPAATPLPALRRRRHRWPHSCWCLRAVWNSASFISLLPPVSIDAAILSAIRIWAHAAAVLPPPPPPVRPPRPHPHPFATRCRHFWGCSGYPDGCNFFKWAPAGAERAPPASPGSQQQQQQPWQQSPASQQQTPQQQPRQAPRFGSPAALAAAGRQYVPLWDAAAAMADGGPGGPFPHQQQQQGTPQQGAPLRVNLQVRWAACWLAGRPAAGLAKESRVWVKPAVSCSQHPGDRLPADARCLPARLPDLPGRWWTAIRLALSSDTTNR